MKTEAAFKIKEVLKNIIDNHLLDFDEAQKTKVEFIFGNIIGGLHYVTYDEDNYTYDIIDSIDHIIERSRYDEKPKKRFYHFTDDYYNPSKSVDDLRKILRHGIELTEIEKLVYKSNKTLDEYVQMCIHPDYRYNTIFPDRASVLSHIFCTYGNGIEFKDGYISGIPDFKNAVLPDVLIEELDSILTDQDVVPLINKFLDDQLKDYLSEYNYNKTRNISSTFFDDDDTSTFRNLAFRGYIEDLHESCQDGLAEVCTNIIQHQDRLHPNNKRDIVDKAEFILFKYNKLKNKNDNN